MADGAWSAGMVWLRPTGAYCVARDERVYTLKPDREERLTELQVTCCRPCTSQDAAPQHLAVHLTAG